MRLRLLAAVFAVALAATAQSLTVRELVGFVQSSQQLIREGKQTDAEVAKYLAKVRLTERLDDRTIEELQGYGIAEKTLQALQALRDRTKSLMAAKPIPPEAPPTPIPPPTSEEQAAILSDVREYALNYSKNLPDFICTQVTRRFAAPMPGTRWGGSALSEPSWQAQDVLQIRLSYFEQKEKYTVVLANNAIVNKDYEQMGGSIALKDRPGRDPYGCPLNIGGTKPGHVGEGCFMTSVAMVLNFLKVNLPTAGGMPVDPDNLNQWLASVPANTTHHPRLVAADCGLGYGSGIWARLGVKISKVSHSSASNWRSAQGRVDRTIWNELYYRPVIAEVWTGSNPHYVVITGEEAWQDYYWTTGKFDVRDMNGKTKSQRIRYQVFSDDGDYLINDPAQSGNENEKGVGLFSSAYKRHYGLMSLYTVHRI